MSDTLNDWFRRIGATLSDEDYESGITAIAAHDAEVRAEALREAARFQTDPDFEFTDLAVVRDWLLDRADDLARDGGGEG